MTKKRKKGDEIDCDDRLGIGSSGGKAMQDDFSEVDRSTTFARKAGERGEEYSKSEVRREYIPPSYQRVIDDASKEIRNNLQRIKDTIHDFERRSIFQEVYAREYLIDLSILLSLSDALAELAEDTAKKHYITLESDGYLRWTYHNEPGAAYQMQQEIEQLANQK